MTDREKKHAECNEYFEQFSKLKKRQKEYFIKFLYFYLVNKSEIDENDIFNEALESAKTHITE